MQAEKEAFVPLAWGEIPKTSSWREYAAVVIECPPQDKGQAFASKWLRGLTEKARSNGTLFVLDEVVTGFRYAPGGAAEYYRIQGRVDLYCFGKTIGNGFPVAALAGRKAIMGELTNGVHFSGTFFGNPLSLAAAKATLCQLRLEPPWEHLYEVGGYLKEQWSALDLPWGLVGHPTRPVLKPEGLPKLDDLRRFLFQRGHVIVDHPWFVTTAHTKEDVDDLVEKMRKWEPS